MGLLDYIISDEAIAENLELDNRRIIRIWKEYLRTFEEKGRIISKLNAENIKKYLKRLKELLDIGLVDLSREESLEGGIIKDLRQLEHSQNIKRVQRLEQCLGYSETIYEYLHNLLLQLYSILKSEAKSLEDIERETEKEIENLKNLYSLESEVIIKIKNFGRTRSLETFQEVFISLLTGEKIIRRMNNKEKALYKKMIMGMKRIFSTDEEEQKNEGITYEWISDVVNSIEDKIHELEANGFFVGQNKDIDFEYVNKPEFVELVREKIMALRKKEVSEEMINIFVVIFREWYNQRD